MRLSLTIIPSVYLLAGSTVDAFSSSSSSSPAARTAPPLSPAASGLFMTASAAAAASVADGGLPSPSSSESSSSSSSSDTNDDVPDVDVDVEIPTNLPSDVGMDYVPLATMLATGQLAEADQFTRDALVVLAGSKAKGRDFVYFTEVKRIPSTDLGTIERLWNKFSNGKFGYSVQKKKYRQSRGDFETFCTKVGWNTKDGEVERKKRWFGASEFVYDVRKAPEGHLPLTSALRGTSLIKQLLNHPVWDDDEWKKEP
ncbi:hypothetical protein ACHAW5_002974 [Stephanodiscus triporus]|uniref:GUN4-like domain-containing protein n=1 Tax=Stephanodiscus triporus TaxID=2934178 RepID=A0ABD3PFD2_9STRA